MNHFLQDVRYALRMIKKSPGFTAIAVLTLALGIGANTAIFSVVDGVLLRPLPYPNAKRIVAISETSPQFEDMSVAYLNFEDWREQNHSFAQLAAYRTDSYNLSGTSTAEHVRGRQVSANFFSLLGVQPFLGRDFYNDEDRPGAPRVAILSYALWQRTFASDRDIVGKTITLTDKPYTVIGVAPEHFWFYSPVDFFTPVGNSQALWHENREMRSGTFVLGLLKPGVTIAQARADFAPIAAHLAEAYPKANANHGVRMKSMMDDVVGDVRGSLLLLLGAVGFVLLIACVNVANLLLVRAASRQKEVAVRAALGASRGQIVRQLLIESVSLSALGGLLGLLLAYWGTSALVAAIPGSLPRTQDIGIDTRVLLFTLGVSAITGIAFGLLPALRASRTDVHDTLKEGIRGTTGRHHRMQGALVVFELGIALVLLVAAGLMVRSIALLGTVDPGFVAKNALTFNVSLSKVNYSTPASIRNYLRQATDKLEQLPGVTAASFSTDVPLRDDSELFYYVEGRPKPKEEDMPWSMFYIVSPGYKDAMGLQLLKGRFLTAQDNEKAPNVIVIDEVLARTMFPGQEAIGQHIVFPFPGLDQPREIVGIVNHVKHWGLAQDAHARIQSQLYMPFPQIPDAFFSEIGAGSLSLMVRTSSDSKVMAGAIQDAVRALDKDQPIFGLETLDDLIQDSLAGTRFATMLLGMFAGVALLLAAIGIYGVVSYLVGERTHEMGIRMALGASPSDVLRLILRYGLSLALGGTLLGLAGSFGLTRLLSSLLYGVSPKDPITFIAVAILLVGIAMLACFIPAQRATRVDPMVALRYE